MVLLNVPYWEMKEVAHAVFHSRYWRLQLCGIFSVDFLPLHFLALVVLTWDLFEVRQQSLLDVEKWVLEGQVVYVILQDANLIILLFVTY